MRSIRLKWALFLILSLLAFAGSVSGLNAQEENKEKIEKTKDDVDKKSKRKSKRPGKEKKQTEKPVIKTVRGLYGKPQTLAEIWLSRQTDFVSLEFMPAGKNKFFLTGVLSGTLKDGKTVSIKIQQDFFSENPGMIHDHLRALRHRAEAESFGKQGLKDQFVINKEFRAWMEERDREWDEKRKQEINDRLEAMLHEELSSAEKGVVAKLEKKLEPQIRQRLIGQIEKEVKSQFPDLAPSQLDRAITRKLNKELNNRVKKEMEDTILNEKMDESSEWLEARSLIHKVVSRHRARITTEVNAEYAVARVKRLEAMKKRFAEEGRVWTEKIEPGIIEKVFIWVKGLLGEEK